MFEFRIETPEGVTYVPWTDGHAVGFKLEHYDGQVEYIYLNPSDDSDDGIPNVFLYQGTAGDRNEDEPAHFYTTARWGHYDRGRNLWNGGTPDGVSLADQARGA